MKFDILNLISLKNDSESVFVMRFVQFNPKCDCLDVGILGGAGLDV
jgi:hypothetical protein